MYGVATLPLINMLEDQNLTHKLYADDGYVAGSLESLRIVPDKLYEHGVAFGYNVIKCHINTKPEFVKKANEVFLGLDVDVIEGNRVLVSVISSDESCNVFLKEKSVNYSNARCLRSSPNIVGCPLGICTNDIPTDCNLN